MWFISKSYNGRVLIFSYSLYWWINYSIGAIYLTVALGSCFIMVLQPACVNLYASYDTLGGISSLAPGKLNKR